MAHLYTMEEEEVQKEKLLQELYNLNDEYNEFVIKMDKKFDSVVAKMENLHEFKEVH